MTEKKQQYPQLARKFHDAESEALINKFWQAEDIFHKSIAAREGAPNFVFYEGPPTANGMPGVHHVIARLTKDIACRYKTMTGHRVVRKAGWDTHGLPVERSVEKQLGIQGREAIMEYGLSEFNSKCRESVWGCKTEWDEFTERLGYWVDLDNPYITYDNDYIETVWWILSRFSEEGLLYRGHKVVPYCPVCGTPISSHEMANSYQSVSDPSIYVKLKVADADEYFLTWTTTPWTLPSNVALAIGEDFDYVRVRHGDDILILAEGRLSVLDEEIGYEILDRFKGRDLLGRGYEQLFPFMAAEDGKDAFKVVSADFVTLDSGSGIVHMAPAFGEDDYQVGIKENLAFFNPVNSAGKFTAEIEPYAGQHVKAADKQIIKDLAAGGQLLRKETYKHDYPFHDRCSNPLIYYATPSWFIRTSELREQLIKANQDIHWVPADVGTGRFGNWLAGNIDWSLSRNRFWGTPLNVWVCDDCGKLHVPSSRADLTELTGEDQAGLDLHRPFVDDITFACTDKACPGTMHRTPEVIDCWFDSGSMPYAQYHYPFENKELFESQFPADFISEGIDQTRGWFYTMLVISTFLSGRSSYKSCLTLELILDKHGKKMSKSVGNTVDPMAIMREVGADPLRWYMLTTSPVWTPTRFDTEGVGEARRKILATLENTYSFFSLYANLDEWQPDTQVPAEPSILDKWILSRLHSVTAQVSEAMEEYNFTRAAKLIGSFVIDDVSNWYVRLSRRRFWKGEVSPDKHAAYSTLFAVLDGSLRMLAPIIPFTAEELYRALHGQGGDVSVHLVEYPASDSTRIDTELEEVMKTAQLSVGVGRALRQDSGLRTRQPLGRMLLHAHDERANRLCRDDYLRSLVAEEMNIKTVELLADPLSVAQLAGKANYRALGPRFGKQAPAAAKCIEGMTPQEIMTLKRDGTVTLDYNGTPTDFTFEEIKVVEAGIDPYVAGSENGLTVALDTTLTRDLQDEGLVREIINKVQNLRKKSGLEVSDRIELAVNGNEDVERSLTAFGERLSEETLARLVSSPNGESATDDFSVDGIDINIAINRQP
jgi:isoleucyl-tRNA synthetase